MADVISQEVHIEMREKLLDGTYKIKYPKVKSRAGETFDEHVLKVPSQTDLGHVALGDIQSTTYTATATRDLSIAGEQIITLLAGKTPKTIIIFAYIAGTSITSHGFMNKCIFQNYEGKTYAKDSIVNVSTTSSTSASATLELGVGQIKLNWSKYGSPTGTVQLQILALYHGE